QTVKEKASNATKQIFDREFQLFKVAYWDDKLGFFVDNEINVDLKKEMESLKNDVINYKNKGKKSVEEERNVQEALNEIAYLFKNKEYQYENEIRLVVKDTLGYKKTLELDSRSK